MSFINATFERTVDTDYASRTNTYYLTCRVTSATGIDQELFVYGARNDTYSHVATPFDLEGYPVVREDALVTGKDFYRKNIAILSFTSKNAREQAASIISQRLNSTNQEWARRGESAEGASFVTFDSGD